MTTTNVDPGPGYKVAEPGDTKTYVNGEWHDTTTLIRRLLVDVEDAKSSAREWEEQHDYKDADLTRLRARIAHLEARLAVEMAEVEAWRSASNLGHIARKWRGLQELDEMAEPSMERINRCTAATDASRRAEKEKPNAQ